MIPEIQYIPVNEPLLDGNEKKYLIECVDTGWISSEGPFVKKFEDGFASRVSRTHGVAVSNGTAALDIAVKSLGIGPGDEVILPTFTIISCLNQIIRSGATPILVDSDSVSWNMNIDQIEEKITARTKAILVVHTYGLPVDMDPILKIAKNYEIKIIEDAAEMHGQTCRGKPCGSFGDISIFSFYANKHITTGEGGMIVTDNQVLAEKCKSLRNLCFQEGQRFVHEELGWNFRLTNLQAAVGLAQLEKLDEHIQRKRSMGKQYNELLANLTNIQLPLQKTDYAENIYWVYGVVLNKDVPYDAKDIMQVLGEGGIGTRPFFWPMHKQPVFKQLGLFQGEKHPVAETIANKGFYLPSGMAITDDQINFVCNKMNEILS
jgi:perosamine synthetase